MATALHAGVLGQGLLAIVGKQGHLLHLRHAQQARADAVVDVVGVVGNFVRQIAQLCFQTGLGAVQKPGGHAAGLARFNLTRMAQGAVLQDAFAGFKAQVQPVELRVALFQLVDHPQALQVVLEAAMLSHAILQGILPGVSKRGVAQVVRQGDGFHQVFVQAQGSRHGTPQLRHLQRMRQTRAVQVPFVVEEHLRLVHQPAKGGGMHDAVAVALKGIARGCVGLRVATPLAARRVAGVGGERPTAHAWQHWRITSPTSASGAP